MARTCLDMTDKLGAYFDRDPIERPKIIETMPMTLTRKDLWPVDEWERMQRIARGEED